LFLTPIEVASACDFIRKLEEELKKMQKLAKHANQKRRRLPRANIGEKPA
jgi:hypothetical protein